MEREGNWRWSTGLWTSMSVNGPPRCMEYVKALLQTATLRGLDFDPLDTTDAAGDH